MAVKSPGALPEGIVGLVIDVKDKPLHYLKTGSGLPLVLLHGGASDSRDWLPAMPVLSQYFTCYAPDLPGFGKNERDEKGYFLYDFIDAVDEFILKLGLENAAVVGHSFGARVGIGVALRGRVNVRKLALVDSVGFGKVTGFGSALMTIFWFLRTLFRRPQPYPVFRHHQGDDPNWCCETEVPSLKIPVLLIWKRLDPYMPLSHGHKAHRLIPGSRLAIIPGFGHAPNKKNTDVFTGLLLDFLKE